MQKRIKHYINTWKARGYPEDIPEEVPEILSSMNLAPSYKAIALAVLTNDVSLKSLGCTPKKSKYYSILKKIEIEERGKKNGKKI